MRRSARRGLAVAAVSALGLLALDGGPAVRAGASLRPERAITTVAAATPTQFLADDRADELTIRAVADGHVITDLGTFPHQYGAGLALGPAGGDAYFVLADPTGDASYVERVSAVTGQVSRIGEGASPTLSPDGRYLAWATGTYGRMVSVRDLRTGGTRTFDLLRQVGRDGTLGDGGTLAWLGDGRLVGIIHDTTPPVERSGSLRRRSGSATGGPASCAVYQGDDTCLILVNPRAPFPGRDARIEIAAIPHEVNTLANASTDHGLLVSDGFSLYRLDLSGTVPQVTASAPVPNDGVVDAISAGGRAVLYTTPGSGYGPYRLWSAHIDGAALTDRHVVIANTKVDGVAW